MTIAALRAAYDVGAKPAEIIAQAHARIAQGEGTAVWITRVSLDQALDRLAQAEHRRACGESLPLFGIPFAVKDNIDVAGLPTTAACPAFSAVPARSATAVAKLEAAGAICLGKTNLDQFATGLTGTRSPYGIPTSLFDPRYITGGSSSGSAVAVADGSVSFALGTDTAGSGRVPAAFSNIVGLKPTRGWLSTAGVVPACRTLDCVSVFAGTVEDAMTVARIAAGFDRDDPFSRPEPRGGFATIPASGFRFGVPGEPLEFFGDGAASALFEESVARLQSLGGVKVEIDFAPFRGAGRLLYGGPWIAERLASLKDFAARNGAAMLPLTREIILAAARLSAVDAFEGFYRLAELARRTEIEWQRMDVLLLPTAGTTYRIADVVADPLRLNDELGLYTNFANLLDLCALAIPAGFRRSGLPFGVTLLARAFEERSLAMLSSRLHRALGEATIGATGHPLPSLSCAAETPVAETIEIAVLGAHLSGQPLNPELTMRRARLLRSAKTAAGYSLYRLPDGRPGLVFDGTGAGHIEIEIWSLTAEAFGSFVAAIPPPLGIGTLQLEDGSAVKGFLCEAHAVREAGDITRFGGWRAFLRHEEAQHIDQPVESASVVYEPK